MVYLFKETLVCNIKDFFPDSPDHMSETSGVLTADSSG